MRFPLKISAELPLELEKRWHQYYESPSDRNRAQEEGIWRRTQNRDNAAESGWKSSVDQRRRIVHYLHDFGIQKYPTYLALVMRKVYLYFSLTLPEQDLFLDLLRVRSALLTGGWRNDHRDSNEERWALGDLTCTIITYDKHPEDAEAGRSLPANYRSVDVTIRTCSVGDVDPRLPWDVLAKGMRTKDLPERPAEVPDISMLEELTPFQVEIGCGVSIEAGVPALHHLHELYRVTNLDDGRFILGGAQDDLVERLLTSPASEFARLGELFQAAFLAEPTPAHRALRALGKSGHMVGPIMTNNFDGLVHRSGLPEHFLRRYDEAIPDVKFHPAAKGLLVIGSHADRRRVQARARDIGLRIVYLDPEGYRVAGRFIRYPLESPRAEDFLCRNTATFGLLKLCAHLGVQID